jgi:hypothetical protein
MTVTVYFPVRCFGKQTVRNPPQRWWSEADPVSVAEVKSGYVHFG